MLEESTSMINSPFDSLLGTTYVPDDDEVVQIKALLSAPKKELPGIDAEMEGIMATFHELEKRRERILDVVAPYQQFISISRRIPDDILKDIFFCCIPEHGGAIMSVKEAPLLLSRVCRRWREISLSTPTLWASLYIPIPAPPTFDNSLLLGHLQPFDLKYRECADVVLAKRVESIQEWFRRARECPLSIVILEGNAVPHENKYWQKLLSAVLSVAPYWKKLDLEVSAGYALQVMALLPSQVPLLESLDITPPDGPMDEPRFLSKSQIFKAPSLRRITFRGLRENVLTIPLNWSTLTHLSIGEQYDSVGHGLRDLVQILKVCTGIVSFLFVMGRPQGLSTTSTLESHHDTSVISLPHLKELSLEKHPHTPFEGDPVVLNLDVPLLQSMNYTFHTPLSLTPLHRWLQSSNNNVRKLETDIRLFAPDVLLACLRLCPNLEILNLRTDIGQHAVWQVDDALLRLFYTPDVLNQMLCPKMEEFEYVARDLRRLPGPTDAGILDLIRGKQSGETPGLSKLKYLQLKLDREQTIPLAEQINPYINAGLNLDLSFEYPHFNDPISHLLSPYYNHNHTSGQSTSRPHSRQFIDFLWPNRE